MSHSDESKKAGSEYSKLRKLKMYTYIQNKLESVMKKDPLLVDTFTGKRVDMKNPTREDYDRALASGLIRSGKLTNEEIVMILRNFFSHGMGSEAADGYFEGIISAVHDAVEGSAQKKPAPYEKLNLYSLKSYGALFSEELHRRRSLGTKELSGYNIGFQLLNQCTGGLQEQRLISLTGLPGSGKTSFALQVAQIVAMNDHVPCLYVSYDQSFFSLNLMLYTRLSGIPYPLIASGQLKEKQSEKIDRIIEKDMAEWGDHFIMVQADEYLDMRGLRSLCQDIRPAVLVVDSLEGLPAGIYNTVAAKIDDLLGSLGRLAIDLNCAVMAISSLEEKPSFSHHHKADAIFHLVSHENIRSTSAGDSSEISLVIEKNRFGKNKVLAYEFNPLLFEFKEKSSQERFRAW